jgi:hypothetical protein
MQYFMVLSTASEVAGDEYDETIERLIYGFDQASNAYTTLWYLSRIFFTFFRRRGISLIKREL